MNVRIFDLGKENLDDFNEHLKKYNFENNCNNVQNFQSLSNKVQNHKVKKNNAFQLSALEEFGVKGWRKIWAIVNIEDKIIGHIEIHSQEALNIFQGILLETGIMRYYLKQKVAQKLMKIFIDFGKKTDEVYSINLVVHKNNTSTLFFHKKDGYEENYLVKNLLKLKGVTYDSLSMCLNIN